MFAILFLHMDEKGVKFVFIYLVFVQVAKARKSMLQSEVALARWVTQEGRGLVVVVNKMDLLKGKDQAELRNKVMKAVPEEVNAVLPQVWPI